MYVNSDLYVCICSSMSGVSVYLSLYVYTCLSLSLAVRVLMYIRVYVRASIAWERISRMETDKNWSRSLVIDIIDLICVG